MFIPYSANQTASIDSSCPEWRTTRHWHGRLHTGLGPLQWLTDIRPFTDPSENGEPDLFFLFVIQEQSVSIERCDALQTQHSVVDSAGTDAHQNVLPLILRDGERGDSYRRMLRWFSNHILVSANTRNHQPEDYDRALEQGRLYAAFEILDTPTGLDFHLITEGGDTVEMGRSGTKGTLVAQCPTVSPLSPTNEHAPTITTTIFKDGRPWA